jgi:phage-related protein
VLTSDLKVLWSWAAAGTCEYVRFDICCICVSSRKLVWLHGEVKTPPFSKAARIEAGYLLRRLQNGERLSLPDSRPMPGIGADCHELRVTDEDVTWRIVYGLTGDAVVILEVFAKKTKTTPQTVIDNCKRRWKQYLRDAEDR